MIYGKYTEKHKKSPKPSNRFRGFHACEKKGEEFPAYVPPGTRPQSGQIHRKMYEQCFSMELKTIEKTLCLCRKPGPSSRNPAKGKEVMNKASEEARFHRRWPGEEPDPAPAPGLLSPDSCLKKCISRGDYPFSKRRRAGLPLFCRPTTVAAPEENAATGKQNKNSFPPAGKEFTCTTNAKPVDTGGA